MATNDIQVGDPVTFTLAGVELTGRVHAMTPDQSKARVWVTTTERPDGMMVGVEVEKCRRVIACR